MKWRVAFNSFAGKWQYCALSAYTDLNKAYAEMNRRAQNKQYKYCVVENNSNLEGREFTL